MTGIIPIHPEPPLAEYNMPFVPAFATTGGKTLWLAGCGPIPLYHKHPHDPAEEAEWMAGGFTAQFARTMANIKKVLTAGGANLTHIVKMTVYLTDMSMQNQLNAAIFEVFGRENPPPRTLIGVACLSHQDMLIEIDVTAVV
jgi:2-aminomuconate deaminase